MPYKTELLVKSRSGEVRSVVIGIPEDQFLKLKAEYPDKGFSGHNPKVDVAIKEGITEDEKHTNRNTSRTSTRYETRIGT